MPRNEGVINNPNLTKDEFAYYLTLYMFYLASAKVWYQERPARKQLDADEQPIND